MARWKLAALALALVAAGCLNKLDAKKVDDAEQRFLAEAASGQYGAIYDEGAPELKASTSRDDFIAMMQRIEGAYGPCKPATKAFDIHVNGTPGGYFTTQGYQAACAKAPLQFRLTTVLRAGEVKVAGYQTGAPPPEPTNSD